MDKFTRQILEQTGLLGMIGKSERGPIAIEAIKDNKAVYLMAVGGAAYLVAQAIKKSKVLAFAELGMEAIYEFEVKDMPVTVAVDTTASRCTSPARRSGRRRSPKAWRSRSSKPAPSLKKPGPAPGFFVRPLAGAWAGSAAGALVQPNQKYSRVRFAAEIRPNNDHASAG